MAEINVPLMISGAQRQTLIAKAGEPGVPRFLAAVVPNKVDSRCNPRPGQPAQARKVEMELLNDLAYTTGMVLLGAAIALVLSVLTSMLILQESWPVIKHQVVEEDSAAHGVLTGALFVAVCALVGVANRQSILPVWDPTWAERLGFMLGWVIYGQVLSLALCYAFNWLLFGLTPAAVRLELNRDRNVSVAAVSGLTFLGVSMLVVFRIF